MGSILNPHYLSFAAVCAAVLLWQCILMRPGCAYGVLVLSLWLAGAGHYLIKYPDRPQTGVLQFVVNTAAMTIAVLLVIGSIVGIMVADQLLGRFM